MGYGREPKVRAAAVSRAKQALASSVCTPYNARTMSSSNSAKLCTPLVYKQPLIVTRCFQDTSLTKYPSIISISLTSYRIGSLDRHSLHQERRCHASRQSSGAPLRVGVASYGCSDRSSGHELLLCRSPHQKRCPSLTFKQTNLTVSSAKSTSHPS